MPRSQIRAEFVHIRCSCWLLGGWGGVLYFPCRVEPARRVVAVERYKQARIIGPGYGSVFDLAAAGILDSPANFR